eukprot:472782-Rhodomonas_salina.1
MDGQQGGDVYFKRTPTMSGDGSAQYERTGGAVVGSMPAADARVQHVDGSYQRLRQIDVVSLYETAQFQVVALDFLLLD